MNFRRASHARPGIAEIVGSMLAIALTVIVGLAVFSYVNDQARLSENQYGQSVGQNVNYLEESFVVSQISYGYATAVNFPSGCSSSCSLATTSLTIYIYNDGSISNQFQQIEVYNSSRSTMDLTFTGSYVTDLNNQGSCHVTATTSLENPLLGTGSSGFTVSINGMSSITLTLPTCYTNKGLPYYFIQRDTYFVKVLGAYGNTVTYYQAM